MKFFVILSVTLLISGCGGSIPNLEPAECTESRDVVKSFYSQHFDSDMKFTSQALEAKKKFFTPEFAEMLGKYVTESDPFTLSEDRPRAFRVSGCKVVEAGKETQTTALVFWKTETRTEQLAIQFEIQNRNGKWLIDNIYNDKNNLHELLNH